jgi:hypothetical protein
MLGWTSSACLVCTDDTVLISRRLLRCKFILASQDLRDFFIHNHVDLDTSFGSGNQHPIKPVLFIFRRRPPQVQLCDTLASVCTRVF